MSPLGFGRIVLLKTLFIKISKNSQENTCGQGLFFSSVYLSSSSNLENKGSMQLYLKKTLAHVFSCEFCEIFKSTIFTEHLWAVLSALNNLRGNIETLSLRSKNQTNRFKIHFNTQISQD